MKLEPLPAIKAATPTIAVSWAVLPTATAAVEAIPPSKTPIKIATPKGTAFEYISVLIIIKKTKLENDFLFFLKN